MITDEQGEELLRALACGELEWDDARVRARAERDARFSRRVEKLAALTRRLVRSGAEQQEILRAATAAAAPAEAAFVARRLRELAGRRTPPVPPPAPGTPAARRPGSRPRLSGIVLAAALLVATTYLAARHWRGDQPARPGDPVLSGDAAVELVEPADGAIYDPARGFSWRYPHPLGPAEQFEVVLDGVRPDGSPFAIAVVARAMPWIPSPTVRAGWPGRVTWSVRVRAQDGSAHSASAPRALSFE